MMTCHFEDTHAKGVNVDLLVIALVVQLWGHELGSAEDRRDVGTVADNGETEVANLELSVVAVDKDVVALEVAVDDGRVVGVEIDESLENLAAPRFEDLGLERALEGLFEVLLQCAGRHELGHKDDTFASVGGFSGPGGVEVDDVLVANGLQDFDLGEDFLGLFLGEMVDAELVPCDLDTFFLIKSPVDMLVSTLAENLVAALESIRRVCFQRILGVVGCVCL